VNSSEHYRDAYVLSSLGPRDLVELWSVKRLPFEPKGWLERMRADLRQAVPTLECGSGEVLHATYMSRITDPCDAENILFYNVGASYFIRSCAGGLRFERVFSRLPSAPDSLTEEPLHYQRYEVAKRGSGFAHWRSDGTLAQWQLDYEAVRSSSSPTSIWYRTKRGLGEIAASTPSVPSKYGLSITLDYPAGSVVNASALVKPLFDGILSAFHSHDGMMVEEISRRLARQLEVEPADVARCLLSESNAVLGRRQLVFLRGKSVQWNPDDDRCVAGELFLNPSERRTDSWGLSGALFKVKEYSPTGPPAPSPPASA